MIWNFEIIIGHYQIEIIFHTIIAEWVRVFFETDVFCTFVTEREAKRNKLLKELATRTDRWLPSNWDEYFVIEWWAMYQSIWNDDRTDKFRYNLWFIFRNWYEYNKYMTEENKDLLFKL